MFSAPPRLTPVPSSPEPGEQRNVNDPVSENDIDRIIDLYGYPLTERDSPLPSGGAGAYCYYGSPHLAKLGGTGLENWADGLLIAALAASNERGIPREDFRLTYQGRSYRVLREDSERGCHLSLRRLASDTPRLALLASDTPAVRTLLEAPWLNDGGLILFSGLTGQGKTTWAGATVRTRLEMYGGRCLGVEDVAEMPLEGIWNGGSCRQLEVDYHHPDPFRRGFAGAVRRAYRGMPATRPAILLIGEVRDTETAEEVVKAAANGMLVLTTIHAADPIGAIMRLNALAEQTMGAEGAAANLAHALRMSIHHSVTLLPQVKGWGRGRYTGSALVSTGPSSAVGNALRKGRFTALNGELEFQATQMLNASFQQPTADKLLANLARSQAT